MDSSTSSDGLSFSLLPVNAVQSHTRWHPVPPTRGQTLFGSWDPFTSPPVNLLPYPPSRSLRLLLSRRPETRGLTLQLRRRLRHPFLTARLSYSPGATLSFPQSRVTQVGNPERRWVLTGVVGKWGPRTAGGHRATVEGTRSPPRSGSSPGGWSPLDGSRRFPGGRRNLLESRPKSSVSGVFG